MQTQEDLRRILARIDGKRYKAYKDIEGAYNFGNFLLFIDHVQGDPFASPSRVRVQVSQSWAGFPEWLYQNKVRAVALQDFLIRKFSEAIREIVQGGRGIGGGGRFTVDTPGQEVLDRAACGINRERIEIRFTMGLPSAGRTILSRQAEEMFFGEFPRIVERSLIHSRIP